MSEVISFRLNKDNLREAKALSVLQAWKVKGYNLRQIITEALLMLDQHGQEQGITTLEKISETLNEVNQLLRQIELNNSLAVTKLHNHNAESSLSAGFVNSVKKSAKSGLKLK